MLAGCRTLYRVFFNSFFFLFFFHTDRQRAAPGVPGSGRPVTEMESLGSIGSDTPLRGSSRTNESDVEEVGRGRCAVCVSCVSVFVCLLVGCIIAIPTHGHTQRSSVYPSPDTPSPPSPNFSPTQVQRQIDMLKRQTIKNPRNTIERVAQFNRVLEKDGTPRY